MFPSKLNEKQKALIARLLKEGRHVPEIVKQVPVSPQRIYQIKWAMQKTGELKQKNPLDIEKWLLKRLSLARKAERLQQENRNLKRHLRESKPC